MPRMVKLLERQPNPGRGVKHILDNHDRKVAFGLDTPKDTSLVVIRDLPTRVEPHAIFLPTHGQKSQVDFDISNLREVQHAGLTIQSSDINIVSLVKDPHERVYVKKMLKRDGSFNHENLIPFLAKTEYPAVGFAGSVRGRNLTEQAEFAERASRAGLPIDVTLYADDETLIMPLIEGTSLTTLIQLDDISPVTPALETLYNAHSKGFVFGDRWMSNMMVRNDGIVSPIDFEVAIEGRNAEEFDMAQLLFSMTGQTGLLEEMLERISEFSQGHKEYNWKQVIGFMQGYEDYLTASPKLYIPRLGDRLDKITQAVYT